MRQGVSRSGENRADPVWISVTVAASLDALDPNQQMTERILQNQGTLGGFNCLSFVAMVVDRFSFEDNK